MLKKIVKKTISHLKMRILSKEGIFVGCFILLLIGIILLPTEHEKQAYLSSENAIARVISVNNDSFERSGLISQGAQSCQLQLLTGSFAGKETSGVNLFIGKMEFDKVFSPGDLAWVLVEHKADNSIGYVNMIEHFRIGQELVLLGIFALGLIIFSGFTGLRTLLSLLFALLAIWKILIPGMLAGYPPLLLALCIGILITIITLLLVGGLTKKAATAILGSIAASLITCLLAVGFGAYFGIHGSVMDWSESLLYAGYAHLDLTKIFQAGIYLACSGAIMDLAIDISSALDEVALKRPGLPGKELFASGMRIGKSVVGTQTTTLLLAYMGSYISVMMVFMAQGTNTMTIFNSRMIGAEILHTLVGCMGLLLVCPLTAAICGLFYSETGRSLGRKLHRGLNFRKDDVTK